MALNDYEEKRSFSRMQVETTVDFSLKSQPGKNFHAISQDLSATGLMMLAEVSLELGEEINVLMNTGNDRLPPFSASGIVRRVEPNEGKYLISVELTQTN